MESTTYSSDSMRGREILEVTVYKVIVHELMPADRFSKGKLRPRHIGVYAQSSDMGIAAEIGGSMTPRAMAIKLERLSELSSNRFEINVVEVKSIRAERSILNWSDES